MSIRLSPAARRAIRRLMRRRPVEHGCHGNPLPPLRGTGAFWVAHDGMGLVARGPAIDSLGVIPAGSTISDTIRRCKPDRQRKPMGPYHGLCVDNDAEAIGTSDPWRTKMRAGLPEGGGWCGYEGVMGDLPLECDDPILPEPQRIGRVWQPIH